MRLCQNLLQIIFKDLSLHTTAKSSDSNFQDMQCQKFFDTLLRFLILARYAEGLDRPLCTGELASQQSVLQPSSTNKICTEILMGSTLSYHFSSYIREKWLAFACIKRSKAKTRLRTLWSPICLEVAPSLTRVPLSSFQAPPSLHLRYTWAGILKRQYLPRLHHDYLVCSKSLKHFQKAALKGWYNF